MKRFFNRSDKVSAMAAALLCSVAAGPVLAQVDQGSAPDARLASEASVVGDIVVTARRRNETLISAPVAVSAVGKQELERRGVTTLDNLAHAVPQLIVSDAGASTQGGVVLIRGIGVGESNPFADQAVSFNIDGVQVSRANIRRLSEVDMQQVEVLKGPQALFFGKNSPAGIISIRTADPGATFEAGVNTSYEFNADELRGDGFISFPVTDALGVRIAAYGSTMKGYFDNAATPSPLFGPTYSRAPENQDYGGRLTVLYDPGGRFDARLKLSYGQMEGSGPESSMQLVDCPYGYNQLSPSDRDCSADDTVMIADPGPNIAALSSDFAAVPFVDQSQILGGLEMNYDLTDSLKLTSVTGYYDNRTRFFSSLTPSDTTTPARIFVSSQRFEAKEFTQELRLASDYSGSVNFMLGAHYQKADLDFFNTVARNGLTPVVALPKTPVRQEGRSWSVFGQVMWQITDTLELSGGGRYSEEEKDYFLFNAAGAALPTASPGNKWDNFSPEVTLAWRPDDNLTVYGAYKTGFLSGGFAVASGNLALDRSYDQQEVSGFEGGIKARLFDGALRGSITAYRYENDGMQVTANIVTQTFGPDQRIVNAGSAVNQGFEAEATYYASDQLSFYGSVGYNRGRYDELVTPCYGGQSIAMGCALDPNASGIFTNQDLSGQPMVRSPDWTIQGGVNYEIDVQGGKLALSTDVNYSSGYYGAPSNRPSSWQSEYVTVDAGILYTNDVHGYTIGILGRNLTDEHYWTRAIDSTFTGSGAGTNNVVLSDTFASVSRGRQILLRFSKRFN